MSGAIASEQRRTMQKNRDTTRTCWKPPFTSVIAGGALENGTGMEKEFM